MGRFIISFVCIGILSACGGGGGAATQPPVAVIPDTIPPVISLTGSNSVELNQGDAYVEQGATAQDNVDGSLAVIISGDVGTAPWNLYAHLHRDRCGRKSESSHAHRNRCYR